MVYVRTRRWRTRLELTVVHRFFVSSTAWLASSPIQGALIQSGGGDNYWKAAVFCGVTTIAGASSLLVTRHLAIKRKGTKIV